MTDEHRRIAELESQGRSLAMVQTNRLALTRDQGMKLYQQPSTHSQELRRVQSDATREHTRANGCTVGSRPVFDVRVPDGSAAGSGLKNSPVLGALALDQIRHDLWGRPGERRSFV